MSPLLKCPLPDENTKKQLSDNQKKLLCLLEKEEVKNKETNYVFYRRFKSEVCHFIEQKKTSKSNFSDGEIFLMSKKYEIFLYA